MDGSVLATVPGYSVGDEHAFGAYLVMATERGGSESTVDAKGVIRPVAPAAAKLLTPELSPLVLDPSTAIIGCLQTPTESEANSSCTAAEINMTTGSVRPLLTVPGTGELSMALGRSLTLLDVSPDLKTVWLRRVTGATAASGQMPSGQIDIIGVDRRTGAVVIRALPKALMYGELAVTRDGKFAAGQEEAGANSQHLAIRHLHVVSLATGVDTDVQGSAPYVGGLRAPSILFAPDGSTVAWWGGLDNGSSNFRVNVATSGSTGKTEYPLTNIGALVSAVVWIDHTRLLVQNLQVKQTFTIDVESGIVVQVPGEIPYLLGVLN